MRKKIGRSLLHLVHKDCQCITDFHSISSLKKKVTHTNSNDFLFASLSWFVFLHSLHVCTPFLLPIRLMRKEQTMDITCLTIKQLQSYHQKKRMSLENTSSTSKQFSLEIDLHMFNRMYIYAHLCAFAVLDWAHPSWAFKRLPFSPSLSASKTTFSSSMSLEHQRLKNFWAWRSLGFRVERTRSPHLGSWLHSDSIVWICLRGPHRLKRLVSRICQIQDQRTSLTHSAALQSSSPVVRACERCHWNILRPFRQNRCQSMSEQWAGSLQSDLQKVKHFFWLSLVSETFWVWDRHFCLWEKISSLYSLRLHTKILSVKITFF